MTGFEQFRCLAAACPDSCCRDWEIEVDPESAARYRALPGALGEALRKALYDAEGRTWMENADGRCPMWRSDGLCRIQCAFGEEALCRTCREFPRLTHDYGSFIEHGLELSCPEAARLLLTGEPEPPVTEPADGTGDYDMEVMALLLESRAEARALLTDYPVPEGLALLLYYGVHVQGLLDGAEPAAFDPAAALDSARELAEDTDPAGILPFFRELEILTDRWAAWLDAPRPGVWQAGYRNLAIYYVNRYWLQAASDLDLYSRAKLAVIVCLLVRLIGGEFTAAAQTASKELENDADNLDALLDAACLDPRFTDRKLLGMLLYR